MKHTVFLLKSLSKRRFLGKTVLSLPIKQNTTRKNSVEINHSSNDSDMELKQYLVCSIAYATYDMLHIICNLEPNPVSSRISFKSWSTAYKLGWSGLSKFIRVDSRPGFPKYTSPVSKHQSIQQFNITSCNLQLHVSSMSRTCDYPNYTVCHILYEFVYYLQIEHHFEPISLYWVKLFF